MAVMKTFCGCMSTKSGAMTVLLLYMIAYIAGMVYFSIQLSGDKMKNWLKTELAKDEWNCLEGEHKESGWCKESKKAEDEVNNVLIFVIVYFAFLIVSGIVAIFGTSKGLPWLILPWICLKFAIMAVLGVLAVVVIVFMSFYWSDNDDSSVIVATGICCAIISAFATYVWLCVVSFFQALRELAKLGLNKDIGHVEPFVNEHDNDGFSSDDDEAYGTKDLDDAAERSDSMEYRPEDKHSIAGSRPGTGISRPGTGISRPGTGIVSSRPGTGVSIKVVDDFEAKLPVE